MRFYINDKRKTRMKRNIQPLVPVSGPRISGLNSFDEMTQPRTRAGPQSKRAIDVYPRAVTLRNGNQRFK